MTIPVDGLYSFTNQKPDYLIQIMAWPYENGEMLVGIKPDGQIEYGPNYTPDEAARRFWEAIGAYRK